ncbi:MAG: hypothetical protein KAT09_00725 [Candidatus Aegiribacteria sp.]|nr:hypothetical protein [Candidatus Aegiribacteria sp.]
MNCPDFDTLMRLLDGELEEEKVKEVSEHLISCSRCRNLIDSQRNLEGSWRDSFVTPDSGKFRSMEWRIFNRINRRSRWKTFVPAAAGIIAVLLGVKLILDNKPSLDRVTDLSRRSRVEYTTDTVQLREERAESLTSTDDGLDFETTAPNAGVIAPAEGDVSVGDATEEIIGEPLGYGVTTDGAPELSQAAADEEGSGESLRGAGRLIQETDRQVIAGGTVTESVSGDRGSAGLSGYEVECEETEITEETMLLGAVEDINLEVQVDEVSDITLSLDADTTGLATVETVPSVVSTSEETQDNRTLNQSCEYHSRFNETSYYDMDALKVDIHIELVFDADGQPDSSTALLLDSLFAGWSDYISFVYRDTVLVIPLSDIRQLFMEGSTVPAETTE